MTALTQDPPSPNVLAREFVPGINDPTAGTVAISREPASEQVRVIADPRIPRPGRVRARHVPAELVNAGMLPEDAERAVSGVALAYGGIAQLLAGGRR